MLTDQRAVTPPGVQQVGLSLLLLAIFAPVVLAVGSATFRPAWLKAAPMGIPISVLWILISIVIFVAMTWAFTRMAFAQANGESER